MIPTLYLSFHRQRTWTYLLTGLLLCLLIGSRLWVAPTTAPVRFSGLPVWAINPTGVSPTTPNLVVRHSQPEANSSSHIAWAGSRTKRRYGWWASAKVAGQIQKPGPTHSHPLSVYHHIYVSHSCQRATASEAEPLNEL